jgi:hypothetical protein
LLLLLLLLLLPHTRLLPLQSMAHATNRAPVPLAVICIAVLLSWPFCGIGCGLACSAAVAAAASSLAVPAAAALLLLI